MPPTHCVVALHRRRPLATLDRSVITVAPVVVNPAVLSKRASVTVKEPVSRYGTDPKAINVTQAMATPANASFGRRRSGRPVPKMVSAPIPTASPSVRPRWRAVSHSR